MLIWLISASTARDLGTVIIGTIALAALLIGPLVLAVNMPLVGIPVTIGIYIWLWRGYETFRETTEVRQAGARYDAVVQRYGMGTPESEQAVAAYLEAEQREAETARALGKRRPPTIKEKADATEARINDEIVSEAVAKGRIHCADDICRGCWATAPWWSETCATCVARNERGGWPAGHEVGANDS